MMNKFTNKTAAAVGALVLGAGVAFSATDANAAVVHMAPTFSDVAVSGGTTGPFEVTGGNLYRFASQSFSGSDAGGALFGFEFTSANLPQSVNAYLTLNRTGDFTNFQAFWSDDNVIDASDTELALGTFGIDENFTFTASPKFLIVSYDAAANEADLDISVSAVPLPAAGFLLFGALGGLAAMRRRKKAA